LSDEEFYKRNEELNKEIEYQQEKLQKCKEEKENISTLEDKMKRIKRTLEKEIEIEKNIEDLIKLLVEKIYVSKIEGNRKHIKLEIYLKIGETVILGGNLNKQAKQEYIIENEKYHFCNNNNNERYMKEKNYQSCDHDIYYSARK